MKVLGTTLVASVIATLFFVVPVSAGCNCSSDGSSGHQRNASHGSGGAGRSHSGSGSWSTPSRPDGRHDHNWMGKQTGITSCSQMYSSCQRGANKPGHGLAYPGVCEDRRNKCMATGAWETTNTGNRYGLARR